MILVLMLALSSVITLANEPHVYKLEDLPIDDPATYTEVLPEIRVVGAKPKRRGKPEHRRVSKLLQEYFDTLSPEDMLRVSGAVVERPDHAVTDVEAAQAAATLRIYLEGQ